MPNATFDSGKKSHLPKFALAKYLLYAQNSHKTNLCNFLKNCSNECRIRRGPHVLLLQNLFEPIVSAAESTWVSCLLSTDFFLLPVEWTFPPAPSWIRSRLLHAESTLHSCISCNLQNFGMFAPHNGKKLFLSISNIMQLHM